MPQNSSTSDIMKVYFVRHGESTFNALGLHQHRHVSLSETGKKQAAFVAKRFVQIPIDIIIASPYTRAQQTAEAINAVVEKKIVYTDLLKEIKRPTAVEKKSITDSNVLEIQQAIRKHYVSKHWHYSDEENFFDLQKRAMSFTKYLEALTEENVLVVTHGMILKMIVITMFLGKEVTPDLFLQFERFFKTSNAGMTVCERGKENSWHLLTWNDSAHLG
ncbi:MAG: histidine phosphatase family protein [Candidatus Levybacteria bacterium]|nr:histidine phosphatase family protein [Candidatus Levybacteria bacterium]